MLSDVQPLPACKIHLLLLTNFFHMGSFQIELKTRVKVATNPPSKSVILTYFLKLEFSIPQAMGKNVML